MSFWQNLLEFSFLPSPTHDYTYLLFITVLYYLLKINHISCNINYNYNLFHKGFTLLSKSFKYINLCMNVRY